MPRLPGSPLANNAPATQPVRHQFVRAVSLGAGLSKLAGKMFRIGHLGSFNDLMLMGTLCGVEMGLRLAGVPHKKGGAQAAMDYLAAPRAVEALLGRRSV
jgi:aspartate aminotransferase-like enzyme